jgi:hypothetical protein
LSTSDFLLDQAAPAFRYLHRHWNGAELYFVFNEGNQPLSRQVQLAGNGQVQWWDAMTGTMEPVQVIKRTKKRVTIELDLKPGASRFIVIAGNVNKSSI